MALCGAKDGAQAAENAGAMGLKLWAFGYPWEGYPSSSLILPHMARNRYITHI